MKPRRRSADGLRNYWNRPVPGLRPLPADATVADMEAAALAYYDAADPAERITARQAFDIYAGHAGLTVWHPVLSDGTVDRSRFGPSKPPAPGVEEARARLDPNYRPFYGLASPRRTP